jgi:predicted PurR-regulated permease PerM
MPDDAVDGLERDQRYRGVVELAIRLAALALLIYGAFVLVLPFVTLIIWAIVLAVALYPAYQRVLRFLGGRRRLAAAIVTALNLLIVIGPAAWLALDLVESIRGVAEKLSSADISLPPPSPSIKTWPIVGEQLFDFLELASNNLSEAAAQAAPMLKPLGTQVLAMAGSAGLGVLMFFVAIIIAGFLFAPAPALVGSLTRVAHQLALRRGEEFVYLAGATIVAVSRGVIGVSALQALLAGIGLTIAGVPGTSLITSGVLILGIVQIGPAVLLIPVIIWAWFSMSTTAAILFTAYMVPVNLMDNVVRPLVIGRGLKTPMLVILIGVIGGTLAYGVVGVFLGPIILAVIWELLVAWMHEGDALDER